MSGVSPLTIMKLNEPNFTEGNGANEEGTLSTWLCSKCLEEHGNEINGLDGVIECPWCNLELRLGEFQSVPTAQPIVPKLFILTEEDAEHFCATHANEKAGGAVIALEMWLKERGNNSLN